MTRLKESSTSYPRRRRLERRRFTEPQFPPEYSREVAGTVLACRRPSSLEAIFRIVIDNLTAEWLQTSN